METSAKGKASEAISKLLQLQPPTALKMPDGDAEGAEPEEVEVSTLSQGDIVKVLPGSQASSREDTTQRPSATLQDTPNCERALAGCPRTGTRPLLLVSTRTRPVS